MYNAYKVFYIYYFIIFFYTFYFIHLWKLYYKTEQNFSFSKIINIIKNNCCAQYNFYLYFN